MPLKQNTIVRKLIINMTRKWPRINQMQAKIRKSLTKWQKEDTLEKMSASISSVNKYKKLVDIRHAAFNGSLISSLLLFQSSATIPFSITNSLWKQISKTHLLNWTISFTLSWVLELLFHYSIFSKI